MKSRMVVIFSASFAIASLSIAGYSKIGSDIPEILFFVYELYSSELGTCNVPDTTQMWATPAYRRLQMTTVAVSASGVTTGPFGVSGRAGHLSNMADKKSKVYFRDVPPYILITKIKTTLIISNCIYRSHERIVPD